MKTPEVKKMESQTKNKHRLFAWRFFYLAQGFSGESKMVFHFPELFLF
jgi:hypothetical protein